MMTCMRLLSCLIMQLTSNCSSYYSSSSSSSPSPCQAFEAYDQSNEKRKAVVCLQYMILTKVLSDHAGDVPALLSSKRGINHAGVELQAMTAIAKAAKMRSLQEFTDTVSQSVS